MALKLFAAMSITLALLFGFLFGLLAAVGYFFRLSGYLIVMLAIALVGLQWYIGPVIIRWTTNMREIEKSENPWLFETVEELCEKTKTPMPKIAVANIGSPNAFVFGRRPSSATLVVTRGLLNNLTKEEVKAVVAHEIGHINHKDMVVLTIVSAIPVLAYFVARFLIFAPKEERRAGMAILVGLIAYLIYFISNLLVLLLSRLREYYADRFSGLNTSPRLLASALAKITYGLSLSEEKTNSAVRAFFIADPLAAAKEVSRFKTEYADLEISSEELAKAMEWERKNPLIRFLEIFQTHPLTFKRINALEELEREIKP